MHVVALHLRSFAKFKDTTVPLAPLTAIVGTNRSGKTSALRSLAILSLLMENAPRDEAGNIAQGRVLGSPYVKTMADVVAGGPSDFLLRYGRHGKEPLLIGAEFSDGTVIYFSFHGPGLEMDYVFERTTRGRTFPEFRCTFFPRDISYGGHYATILGPLNSNTGGSLLEKLTDQLWDGSNLGKITSNIVYYLHKKHPETFNELQQTLQSMFAGLGDIQIQLQGRNINFQFGATATTTAPSWVREGSGVAYVVSVFAAILFDKVVRYATPASPEPLHLLALDEPSSPLHPHLIGIFLDKLQTMGISQVIMATHSIDLLAQCTVRNSSFVSFDANPPFAIPSVSEPLLSALGVDLSAIMPHLSTRPDDLMLLGARRCLLFVENAVDWKRLQEWMDRVDSSKSRAFAERVVVEWLSGRKPTYHYCENVRRIANVLATFQNNPTSKPLRVAVSVDGDYIPVPILRHEQKQFKILLQNSCGSSVDAESALWLTWKKIEGENYLLDKDLIIQLIKSGTIKLKHGATSNPEDHWNSVLTQQLQAIETRFVAETVHNAKVKGDDNVRAEDKFNAHEEMPSLVDYISTRWKEGCADPTTIIDAKPTLEKLGVSEELHTLLIRKMVAVPEEITKTVETLFTWAQV